MTKPQIIIKRPYITNSSTLSRINAEIIENGVSRIVFCEVEKEYEPYLSINRADFLLLLTLPLALRRHYDIVCETPVTEQFLHNLEEVLIPALVGNDGRLMAPNISVPTEVELIQGEAVGTGISCGVDSLYTTKVYLETNFEQMKLTHLFISASNYELWDTANLDLNGWIKAHEASFERFHKASKMLGLPLVMMYTNFVEFACRPNTSEHIVHIHIHEYITMATVLALKKLWKTYYFSSTYDFSQFTLKDNATEDVSHYELLMMHALTVPGFSCFSGGANVDRVDKTLALADWEPAKKILHTCNERGSKNCSLHTCQKCTRALLVFDYYDKLDSMSEIFDVDYYRKNRDKFLWMMIYEKKSYWMNRLYEMFLEKYPEDMKRMIERHNRDIAPIDRNEYNILSKCYNITLMLMLQPNPKQFLIEFFTSKGYNKIYISGSSNLGTQIISMIKDELEIRNYKNDSPKNCDVCFIVDTHKKDILSKESQLRNKGATKFLYIDDLKNELEKLK